MQKQTRSNAGILHTIGLSGYKLAVLLRYSLLEVISSRETRKSSSSFVSKQALHVIR